MFLLTGCAQYKVPTSHFCAAPHPLYTVIPRHRCQIRCYDLPHWAMWALFGNDDDGLFGECCKPPYRCSQHNCINKALRWNLRNPLHNFCFYVIGSAHCQNSEVTLLEISPQRFCIGRYRSCNGVNFPSDCSSLFIALHGWKPFISLRIKHCPHRSSDFYIGWRERGNFGIKCNLFNKK
ncbi:MAG: hypothetical protein H7A37_06425 [Chlamydiales bacterium]|nr:hypothetical protein [Chlamydiia bacterium]MCP5507917.1 hypothetical protein [Chlamydiales bacterium]